MQHAEAFRTFSSGCERLIFSIKTNPPSQRTTRVSLRITARKSLT